MATLTPLNIYRLFFLTAVFGFLFFGSNALATNCLDIAGTQSQDFSCDITYTDTGGSNLAECKFKVVGQGNDTGWLLPAGTCSGSSAALTATIEIPEYTPQSGSYTIKWYSKDGAGNENQGDVSTINVASCISPAFGNWEIYRYCVLETSGSDLQIKDGATVVKTYFSTNTLTLNSDVYIKNGGTLDMKGNSNISFSGSPRYIYVDPGGNLYQAGTAGINK